MPSQTATASTDVIVKKLLERHVQHELSRFEAPDLMDWIREETGKVFDWLNSTKLNQIITAEQIKEVIHRNVVERQIPGAITEVAGDAASRLFSDDLHLNTPLNEIIGSGEYEDFVDKLLELHEQRNNGLDLIIDLPIYKELISDVIYQAMIRYIYDSNVISKKIPGVSSLLKMGRAAVHKTAPKLEGAVEENVKSYIADNLGFLLHESKTFLLESLTDEQLKNSAQELWDAIENRTLGEFQEGMDSLDLSEFIVLGYEFWLRFRQSKYFKDRYELVVDYLFERYGDNTLDLLFDDFLITTDTITEEVERFAPKILNTLKQSGQLEALIRRRLEHFYHSDSALKCFE